MSRPPVRRDYALTGAESQRAVERGLADAAWYRPPIDGARLRELTMRTDRRAARDTALWLVLLAGTGAAAFVALGSWWAVPAFAAYGALYGGAADSRWHEMGHGTAFRTGWLNDAVYHLASFMLLRGPTLWRWSHVRHHTDTIVVGRDPEIAFPRPPTWRMVAATFLGLRVVLPMLVRHVRHAGGRIDDDAREIVPEGEHGRLVRESRLFLAVLAAAASWAALAGSVVPLLYIGLPSIYGAWLLVFFGFTQHAGLREDVLDHRLNTRTVHMNPLFRFLYSNMNYHVEHHLFPTVPYHALPALHAEVKDHLAPALPSTVAAYREILAALAVQRREPSHEIPDRLVPTAPGARRASIVVGQSLWAHPAIADPAPAPAHAPAAAPAHAPTPGREAVDLGSATELGVGEVRRVDACGLTLAVYRLGATEYAVTDGLCTHGRAALADGVVDGTAIECPKHNGRFDIRTGAPLRRPAAEPIATHEVTVVDGRLVAELPCRPRPEPAG